MGNMIDYVFMESYSPIRDMVKISYAVGNAKSLKTTSECLKILDMIPSERNFIIRDNIAIGKSYWIKNELPISELLCIEGLNECHFIKVNKELHYLIAKANLYASSTMY